MTAPGSGFRLASAYLEIGAEDQTQTKVSEIRARLQTLNTQFGITADTKSTMATLAVLKAELKRLSETGPTIPVRVDAAKALAELEGIKLASDGISSSADKGGKSLGGMLAAGVQFGPMIVPIVTAAGAGVVAVTALGVTGALAFKGIQTEMAAGTKLGDQFDKGVTTIKGDLAQLEHTAAGGVLHGFQDSVSFLHSQMPNLNSETYLLSGYIGDISKHTIKGLVTEFENFEPTVNHISAYVDQLSQRFDTWASGPGGAQFANRLGADFEKAIPDLENIVELAGKLFLAFDQGGGGLLHIIGTLADDLDKIPMPVLTALATTFVTINTAKNVGTIFDKLGGGLDSVGSKGKLAGTGLGGVLTTVGAMATEAGPAAVGMVALGIALDSLNAPSKKKGFWDSVVTDLGFIRGNFAQGVKEMSGGGQDLTVTTDNMTEAQKKHAASLKLDQATYADYLTTIAKAKDQQQQTLDLTKAEIAENFQLMGTQDQLSKKYGITTAQVQSYAAMLGISQDMVVSGQVNAKQYSQAVTTIASAENGATQTGSAFLTQLQQFSQSAGTAADRAALISATLKAAAGDSLNYATQMNNAAVASKTFSDNITSAAKDADKTTGQYLDSIVNLKTGSIDYKNAAAAPLIAGLQQIQDANLAAASATYQHNVATEGGKRAADDAYNQYVSQTGPMLEKQLTGLGLNSTAAHKLAQEYLGVPSDIKTKIEAEGTDPVVQVLNQIGQQLAYLTGHPWAPTLDANTTAATHQVQDLQHKIDDIQQGKVPGLSADSAKGKAKVKDLQDQINAIKQQNLPGLNVNKTVANQKVKDLQSYINAIKQGKVPGLTATNDRGKAKIADLQTKINTLKGKTVDVNVHTGSANTALDGIIAKIGDINSTYVKPPTSSAGLPNIPGLPPTHASGGSVADGWFSAGERGYELGYKHGNQVEFLTHAQSVSMTGMERVPGYAGGTVNGIRYATDLAYHNAQVRARASQVKQEQSIKIKLDSGDTRSVMTHLFSSVASLSSATHTMLVDTNKAISLGMGGRSLATTLSHENAKLMTEAGKRAYVAGRLKSAQAQLAAATKLYTDERTKISQAVMGTFDITNAGAGTTGSSVSNLIASLQTDVTQSTTFKSTLAKLKTEGLNKTLYEQLAAGGPSSANAQILANASQAQITQINSLYHTLGVTSTSVGTSVADTMYGAGVNAAKGLVKGLQSQEKSLEAQMKKLASTMVNQIKHDLKIHSPSQVGHEIGANYGKGIHLGMDSEHDKIASAASRYGTAMTTIGGSPARPATHIEHLHVHVEQLRDVQHLLDIVHGIPQAARAGASA